MKTLILAALIAFSTTPAYSEWLDGNDLEFICEPKYPADESSFAEMTQDEREKVFMCSNYIMGLLDGVDVYAIAKCIPEGVNLRQIMDMVRKYLKENPNTRHHPASEIIMKATSEFECKF